jgi:tyrosine-protein kinase Etk/Wzc
MNLPQTQPGMNQASNELTGGNEGGGLNLLDMLDVLIDQRWLIGLVAAVTMAVGVMYAVFSTPIYEADTLIQVEDTKGNPMGALVGEASGLFDIKSPATAEIEIIRSRMVLEQAIDKLNLNLDVSPKYWPVIGVWMARRSTELSKPGLLFWDGYVNGQEAIQLEHFSHSGAGSRKYVVRVTDAGYLLMDDEGRQLASGVVGRLVPFQQGRDKGQIAVKSIQGRPGAEFLVGFKSRQSELELLRKNLKISEQGKQSGVLKATISGSDPENIAAILNEIGAQYVKQNVARKAAEAEKSLIFLNAQLPALKKELEQSEDRYNGFRNSKGTFDLGTEAKAILDQSSNLNVKLLELVQKRKELELRYTDQHPAVQAVEAQIKNIKGQMTSFESKAKHLPSVEQDLLRLARDVKVSAELYTSLSNTAQQLRLVKEGKVGNVRVVDVAQVPEKPVRPIKPVVISVALALGLVLGVVIAFVKNSFNTGIKDASEIESHLGMGVYATIPYSAKQAELAELVAAKKLGLHLLAVADPSDAVIESLRSLRTSIQFALLESSNNIMLVTGPTPGIGKSFISANFAAVMAATGKKVLLIDADMRRGHLHEYFDLQRGLGMSDLIADPSRLDKIKHTGLTPNLDFITTGNIPPNPAELLGANNMKVLLDQFSSEYDLVLIDSPPVLAVSDASVLATDCGSVFMVARADQTSLGELHESKKRLSQVGAKMPGVIFNGLDMSRRRYGYGGYKYGYRYSRYRYRYYAYGSKEKR